jgi:hypothetical protein
MVTRTKAQRSASAKKAAITRKRNAKLKAAGAAKTAPKKRSVKRTAKRTTAKRSSARKITTKSRGKRR